MSLKKVAVIGLGNIGAVVAQNLSKSNVSFVVSGRDAAKTKSVAAEVAPTATVTDMETAVTTSDIIVLAIPFGEIVPFINQYAKVLTGKIIVDPSNPIAPDDNGGFKKIIDANTSAGELIAAALPEGVKFAKALGTLGAGSLSAAAFKNPENVLFYATDDATIDDDIEQLIVHVGFAPVKAGNVSQSIRIEVFGDLHEFGALGKAVTVPEAKAAL